MSESSKRAVTIFTIAASLLPSVLLVRPPESSAIQMVALYIAAMIGYMGIVLLLWMYMLGTKSVTSLVFTDLAPVLALHKWLGKYAVPMIFLHPVLITVSKSEAWFYPFIPRVDSFTNRHILLGQIAILCLAITWFISALLRDRIAFRPWKYLHYLAYICVPFALLHVPDLGSQEQLHVSVKTYLYLLAIIFIIFTILRLRSLLNLDRAPYTIQSQRALTSLDTMMTVTPVTAKRLSSPRRGQYVYIKLGYISEDHPFSVTKYNKKTGAITLAYRTSGMYTKELHKLKAGGIVYMDGPFGSFTHDIDDEPGVPVVYIAGGIGITPFVERILHESDHREQWLFTANRTRKLAVYADELQSVLGSHYIAAYDHEAEPLGKYEVAGRISRELLNKYLVAPQNYRYYICGPLPMMKHIRNELENMGIDPAAIRSERFGW